MDFSPQVLDLLLRFRRAQIQGRAHKEIRGLADAHAGMIHAGVEALFDELNQTRGYQIIIIHGFGIIANRGRIAHDHEYIANAQGMGSQQVALDAQQVASTRREMQGGLHIDAALHHITDCPSRHPHARHGGIGHIDDICAGLGQERSAGDEFVSREAARRVHLDRDDKFSTGKLLRKLGRLFRVQDFRSLRDFGSLHEHGGMN